MLRLHKIARGRQVARLPDSYLNALIYEADGIDRVLEDLAADGPTPAQESDWDQANDGEPFDGLE